jgi:hypothetical protein
MLATGRIGDQYLKRCNVPTQGTGSPNVFANQRAVSTIGKQTVPYQEKVPCPTCCKTHVAPVITGSPKVFVNQIAIGRLSSLALGITGSFPETTGSRNVFVR